MKETNPRARRSAGAMLRRQRVCSSAPSPSSSLFICMPLSHLCPSHHHFYHRGNWPTHLLVVAGSGEGTCTPAAYYSWVLLQRSYCPLLPIGGQQKTLQRMLCASRRVCFLCCPACLSVPGLFEGWLPFRRTWSSVCRRHGSYSTSSSLEPNFWNNPNINFYHCLSKDELFFLQDRRHRFLTFNGLGVFQNFTSCRGQAVGFSLGQGGTRCWGDLTCSVWFTAEV